MKRHFSKFGSYWRVLRRLKFSQIVGRLCLRYRQFKISKLGIDKAVPRTRSRLAIDYSDRLVVLSKAVEADIPSVSWSNTAGLRYRGNSFWSVSGPERALRYERELTRLELFYHEFLNQGALDEGENWDFIKRYLEGHRERVFDSTHEWHPYSVSNRLASWLIFLSRTINSSSKGDQEVLALECLLLTNYLKWMLERDIEANHLLKNYWAIAISDLILNPDSEQTRLSVEAYTREFEGQLLKDGGHYELCPMYHAKVLYDALLLEKMLPSRNLIDKRFLASISKGKTWLRTMCMGPKQWANINDSWSIPSLSGKLWGDDSWVNPETGLTQLESSGFFKGVHSDWQWLFDIGGVSPRFNPGHSHSDVLSLLVSSKGVPVIVDPGVLHYSPNDERLFLKSCHAHNGPCLRDRDHTELIGSFRIGRDARAVLGNSINCADFQSVSASHYGYAEVQVAREVIVKSNHLEIVDTWSPLEGGSYAPWLRFLWNGCLDSVTDCSIGSEEMRLCFRPGIEKFDLELEIRVVGASEPRLAIQESWYSDQFGKTNVAFETLVSSVDVGVPMEVRTQVKLKDES